MKKKVTDLNHFKLLILPRWYPNKTDVQLGTFIQEQAGLMAQIYEVTVIYVQAFDQQDEEFLVQQVKSNQLTEITVYFKSGSKIQNYRRYKRAQELGLKKVNENFDICHVHVPYRSAMLALDLKKKGIPFVITEHWSGHLTGAYSKKNPLDKYLYKKVLRLSEGITTVSELLRTKFKENTGFESEVIPNLIQHAQSPMIDLTESIQLLSVGDFNNETKNITGLIDAFNQVAGKIKNLKLTLVGGGPDEKLIFETLKKSPFSERIIITGRLNHKLTLAEFGKCHIYICNSNFETFGMAVAEALMAGKPVISTKCGGPEEFIHTKNGLLIEKGNSDALASAIEQMIQDRPNYNSQQISDEMTQKFGKEQLIQQWDRFYEKTLHRTRSKN